MIQLWIETPGYPGVLIDVTYGFVNRREGFEFPSWL